jgi:multiple sugar transport system substrate-binding protein
MFSKYGGKMKKIKLLFFASFLSLMSFSVSAVDITIARFFGECEDAGSDTTVTSGEACIIQSIINAFDEQNPDINVTTEHLDWGQTYNILQTRYADKSAPDIHIMHRHRIPQFSTIGAIADLSGELEKYGMDSGDIVPMMMDALTYDGGMWGLPLDIHAGLFHTNLDLMAKAGLVKDGKPIYPTSPEEMLEHARACKAVGADYIASGQVRTVFSLVWQQNSNFFDGKKATLNTDEVKDSVQLFLDLKEIGAYQPELDYGSAEKFFMDGNSCILYNGTWVVDYYSQNVDFNYYVGSMPTLYDKGATWADSHMWSIPATLKSSSPEKYDAVMKLAKFMWDHSIDWSRTGHMSYRSSVINSDAYKSLPHRTEYASTADIMTDTPHSVNYGAIISLIDSEIQAIILGEKELDKTLKDANNKLKKLIR